MSECIDNNRRLKVAYKKAIVTFFDILGFRNMVEKKESSEIAAKLLGVYEKVAKRISSIRIDSNWPHADYWIFR